MFEHTKSRRYGSDTNTNDEYDLGNCIEISERFDFEPAWDPHGRRSS